MQGCRPPSFLPTKKKPAEAGEVDGRIKTLASSSLMYASIALASCSDNGKILSHGGVVLGRSTMV